MRPEVVFTEAIRGVSSGTSRALVSLLFAALVACSLVVADAGTTRNLIDASEQFRDAGAATLVVTATPNTVKGSACDGLTRTDGVTSAGAVKEADDPLVVTALPNAPLKHYLATKGFVELLVGSAPRFGGLAVSRDLADALRLNIGDVLPTSEGPTLVGAIFDYPSDGRRTGFGWSVVEASPSETFSECWASSWPIQPRLRSLLLTALTPEGAGSASNPPTVAQLNATKGLSFDGAGQWAARVTRFAPFAGFLLIAAFACLLVWLRRLEVASNLHAGVRRRTMIGILLLESTAWVIPASAAAIMAAVFTTLGVDIDNRLALIWIGFQVAATVVTGSVFGILVAAISIREQHLFAFFKNRN